MIEARCRSICHLHEKRALYHSSFISARRNARLTTTQSNMYGLYHNNSYSHCMVNVAIATTKSNHSTPTNEQTIIINKSCTPLLITCQHAIRFARIITVDTQNHTRSKLLLIPNLALTLDSNKQPTSQPKEYWWSPGLRDRIQSLSLPS